MQVTNVIERVLVAEFIAAAVYACQAIWMKRVLKDIGHEVEPCIIIRFHFLRNLTKEGSISLEFCGTTSQAADILTKTLKNDFFLKLRSALGMCSPAGIS
ncbi:hypothetical protein LIER_40300 [Lithospermum erythrorhizon]|uniref:Retrovirus-related Pol polyprotein from transposon TNT 1-94 n=1 Tax=Lithospermum erythrorhizon TaxID=34254 RepID=A0AAV3QY63_LITER